MHKLESQLLRMDTTEELAAKDTWIHRLDPRAKIIVALSFVAVVASYPRYTLADLTPFALYPMLVAAAAGVPWSYLGRRMLMATPFVLALGMLNPLVDREPLVRVGALAVSGGWVSCFSIILRALLCISAALLLLATTGVYRLGRGLRQFGVPAALVTQVLFLYRYLFLLMEEGLRMARAARVRSPRHRHLPLAGYAQLVGSLLLRALTRAEHVHLAMCCRGYRGRMPSDTRERLRAADVWTILLCLFVLVILRISNLPAWVGQRILEFSS